MKKIKKIKKEVEEVTDILCDMCGKSCKTGEEDDDNFDYLEIKGHFGFYSNQKDGETWSAHICQDCADILDKTIAFSKTSMFGGVAEDKRLDNVARRKRRLFKAIKNG